MIAIYSTNPDCKMPYHFNEPHPCAIGIHTEGHYAIYDDSEHEQAQAMCDKLNKELDNKQYPYVVKPLCMPWNM